jgi:hypothetical protein
MYDWRDRSRADWRGGHRAALVASALNIGADAGIVRRRWRLRRGDWPYWLREQGTLDSFAGFVDVHDLRRNHPAGLNAKA